MSHKLLERQYQQHAQRRHEEHLRQEFYEKAARYFERETVAARQFNSWQTRSTESYSDYLEKKRKEERLENRRAKLREMLDQENEDNKRELEERERLNRRRSDDNMSLEDLRRRLLESRAEQSLYYPDTCRKSRSFISSPRGSSTECNNEDRPAAGLSQQQSRISTSLSLDRLSIRTESEITPADNQRVESTNSPNDPSPDDSQQNLRFANRPSHASLANTNIRDCDMDDWSVFSNQGWKVDKGLGPSGRFNNKQHDDSKSDAGTETDGTGVDRHVEVHEAATATTGDYVQTENNDDHGASGETHQQAKDNRSLGITIADLKVDQPGDPSYDTIDSTMQLYRYLKHEDFKSQIEELSQREQNYVIRQFWDEALRLREMKNELILLKNKNLYENGDLNMNDEIRKSALRIIEAREALQKKRVKMSNSMMYSDEARELWNQWDQEDCDIEKEECAITRDQFLVRLEEEWKTLALSDKERISKLYGRVMTRSDLQDEHKIAAAFRLANERQNRYSNCAEGKR